jgi:hypothetical protein
MAKSCSTVILNACATFIRDNAQKVAICTSVSTNTVASVQANMLAETTLTTGAGSTSYTIGAGDVSGVKITITSQASIAVATTGVAQRLALYSSVTNVVYAVTECTTQALTSTLNKVTIPTFDVEFQDAT